MSKQECNLQYEIYSLMYNLRGLFNMFNDYSKYFQEELGINSAKGFYITLSETTYKNFMDSGGCLVNVKPNKDGFIKIDTVPIRIVSDKEFE